MSVMLLALQVLTNAVASGAVYAVVGLGFLLVCRSARFFDLLYGGSFLLAPYVAFASWGLLPTMPILAVAAGLIASGALGAAANAWVYRQLRERSGSALAMLLASFGLLVFVQNVLQLVFGSEPIDLELGALRRPVVVGGLVLTAAQLATLVAVASFGGALAWFLRHTRLGKSLRAVSVDPGLASAVGVHTDSVVSVAVLLGSALAGLSGVLVALEFGLKPAMGLWAVIKAVTACIVGGMGGALGVCLGGLLIGVAENLVAWLVDPAWKDAGTFLILVLALILRRRALASFVPARRT